MRGLIGILGRVVMVAVAAILIGGCLAAPAAARTRDDGVQEANDFISACHEMGGDPEVIEASDDWIITSCKLPNGDNFQCDWSPGGDWSQHCHLFHSVPGDVWPIFEQVAPGPIGGVFVEDEPAQVNPPPSNPPADSPAAAPVDPQDDDQNNEPKKKKKRAKKGKKGKGKGKAKQRGKGRGGR